MSDYRFKELNLEMVRSTLCMKVKGVRDGPVCAETEAIVASLRISEGLKFIRAFAYNTYDEVSAIISIHFAGHAAQIRGDERHFSRTKLRFRLCYIG